MEQVLSIVVRNQPGVLMRVAGMFSRRGYNIDSLAVGITQNPEFSRMTVTMQANETTVDQVCKQLAKLVEVEAVKILPPHNTSQRSMALIKVQTKDKRLEILRVADVFRAHAIDISGESLTFLITGDVSKLRAFEEVMKPYGIMVGYPSVGKSSIVSRVSAARPDIAAYHFTTLTPVLGVVRIDSERSFVLADLPGLIEGAASGVGLGHDFLRHIERTKVILHVLDVSGMDGRDPVEDFDKINKELALYSERLAKRHQLVVANKMDLPDAQENYERVAEYVTSKGYEIMKVSAATGEGLQALMYKAYEMLQNFVPDEIEMAEAVAPENPDSFEIVPCEDANYEIKGKNIERLVAMTNFDNEEALYRFQLIWRKLGIEAALKAKGVKEGQSIRIRDMVFEYKEQE